MAKTPAAFPLVGMMQKLAAFTGSSFFFSLPIVSRLLHNSGGHIQLSLTVFFVGSIVGELLVGPLSKMIGCKQIFFLGAAFYLLSALVIRFSSAPSLLLVARSLQAFGALASVAVTMYSFYTATPVLPIKALANPAMGFRHLFLVLTIGIVMGSLSNKINDLALIMVSLPTAIASFWKPLRAKFSRLMHGQGFTVEPPLLFYSTQKVAHIYARSHDIQDEPANKCHH
jgi:DHA1 family bicyclomycin/chloramphenicol resistance-like MFS transporter